MSKESVVPVCPDPDTLLKLEQVARLLGVTRLWVAERVGSSKNRKPDGIPFVRVGARTLRIRRSDLDAWIAAHTKS